MFAGAFVFGVTTSVSYIIKKVNDAVKTKQNYEELFIEQQKEDERKERERKRNTLQQEYTSNENEINEILKEFENKGFHNIPEICEMSFFSLPFEENENLFED